MKTSCCQSKKFLLEKEFSMCINRRCENYMRPTSLKFSIPVWNKIFLGFFLFFFFFLTFNDFSYNNKSTRSNELNRTNVKELIPLTEENLRRELDSNHIICPEQVYAQIMIESGHLNSYLTKKTNNLLGMRYPFKRSTSAVGIFLPATDLIIKGNQTELKKYKRQNTYAVYENWQDCIRDYKFWQEQTFKLTEIYLTFLGNVYAEDTLYISKIRSIAK